MDIFKFITKLVLKGICLIVSFILIGLLNSFSTVFGNEIAMGQLQNSDTAYVIMDIYHNFSPAIKFIIGIFTLLLGCSIGIDTHNFIETHKKKEI